jgi:hypothetical protein
VTGEALIAEEPAQAGYLTQTEAPKPTNKSANEVTNELPQTGGLVTAHPKPEKRKNARERAMEKKSGGRNDRDDATSDGTKPMTAEAKFKVENKAAKAKEKAAQKAKDKAQKADTKARKISAAKAAKAARG